LDILEYLEDIDCSDVEDMFDRLEKISCEIKKEQTSIEESYELYEIGNVLLRKCQNRLKSIKEETNKLKRDTEKQLYNQD
jgi:exodeoxyribonuclease VII small subunit